MYPSMNLNHHKGLLTKDSVDVRREFCVHREPLRAENWITGGKSIPI